jgi:hypothetical protein
MLLERGLGKWLMWWTEGNVNVLRLSKSVVKGSEVKGSAVKGGKSGRTVKGTYGWWSEVKWSEVKWSEDHVKIGVQYLWSNNI